MPSDDSEHALDLAAEYASGGVKDLTALCADRPDLRGRVESLLRAGGQLAEAAAEQGPVAEVDGEPMPDSLGRYELIGRLGQGAMGIAFRGRDPELNRDVAVKLLRSKAAHLPSAAARFLDEARITAQLQHPTIPAVHEIGTHADGRPWMAMKLIKGVTLGNLRPDDSPTFNRFTVFESICQGLSYAHSKGVIHRDLKPHNVMVGAFGEVQVMDWGLAKVLSEKSELETASDETVGTVIASDRDSDGAVTRAGTALGSPAYMPPEQAIGAVNRIDRRSDVFGLGAILCHLLTGQPPFVGANSESTRQMAAMGKLGDAFARLDASGSDPEWITLCKRCLAAERDERPADAGDVATAVARLRAAADDRAKLAEVEKGKAEVRVEGERKRRRVLMLSVSAVVAVLLAGIGVSLWQVIRAQDAEAQAKRERDDKETARADAAELAVSEHAAKVRESEERGKADAARAEEHAAKERETEARAKADLARNEARESVDVAIDALVERTWLDRPTEVLSSAEDAFLRRSLTDYRQRISERKNEANSALTVGEFTYRMALIHKTLGDESTAKAELTAADKMLSGVGRTKTAPDRCWSLQADIQRTLSQWTENQDKALKYRRAELALRLKLAERAGQESSWLTRTSECLEKIAGLVAAKDAGEETSNLWTQALEFRERLIRLVPWDHRNYIFAIENSTWLALSAEGDQSDAAVKKVQTLCDSANKKFPKRKDIKEKWASVCNDIALASPPEKAAPLQKRAFELRLELAAAEADSESGSGWQDLADALTAYNTTLIAMGKRPIALANLKAVSAVIRGRKDSGEPVESHSAAGEFFAGLSIQAADPELATETHRLAVREYAAAAKLDGNSYESVNTLVQHRIEFGKHLVERAKQTDAGVREFKTALQEFEKIVLTNKSDEPMRLARKAAICNELRHYTFPVNRLESIKYAETVVELQPNVSIYRYYLAKHLFDERLYEKALPQATEAVRLDSKFADAHGILGQILAAKGDLTGARNSLSKAAAIDARWKLELEKMPIRELAPAPRPLK